MARLSYQQLIDKHLEILRSLQYDSGLFAAADRTVSTGYDKSWLRDNFYETIAFEVINDWATVENTYAAILEILVKHEAKIDWAIENKPTESYQYIHARFHPTTFDEFWESWGNKQNDAIGCILFRIGELEKHHKRVILKDEDHVRIVNKLVKYLGAIEYWKDRDSGMWEEDEELHASSVGACVAGLESINRLEKITVPKELIENGKQALRDLLPRESARKFVDLSLLSLIWPYNVTTPEETEEILTNVEYHLLRERGVIRYKGDAYYNKNVDTVSEEAEWTFGLAWLSIIYQKRGEKEKAFEYIKDLIAADTSSGIPELYFSNSPDYNDNTPLGWSESLFIVALYEMERGQSMVVEENEYLTSPDLLPFSDSQLNLISRDALHIKELSEFDVRKVQKDLLDSNGKQVYAIDLGGDKIAAQIFAVDDGKVITSSEIMMNKGDYGKGYLQFLEDVASKALDKNLKVGLSVAGPLNGTVLHMGPNVQEFGNEFEAMYQSDFAKLFAQPVVDNDAVAGLKAGAIEALSKYPEVESVLYIISGSGFGGALLHQGKILALEPGHISLSEDLNVHGITDPCGVFENQNPCVEMVASGKAGIEKMYEKLSGERASGHEINTLAQKGDARAITLYDESARMTAIVVKGIGNTFGLFENPQKTAVVFHGGVFNVAGYKERLEQYLARNVEGSSQLIYTKNMKENACLKGAAIAALCYLST